MMADDMELVREFAARRSDAAFETLVSRHLNLVYSVALRQVRDPHLAQEVAQAVFIILAQKAKSLGPNTIMPGWLFRTAQYASADALKIQLRRQHREQEAYMQSILTSGGDASSQQINDEAWAQIAPLLDAAMLRLGEKDRNAILLRFFENKNLREVGAALGASEDSARVRINRALEKLRKFFTKRGVMLSATVIAAAVSANSVQAAPVGLAAIISATAVKSSAVAASTLTLVKGALKLMAWIKIKTAVVVGVGVLLAAGTTTITIKEIQSHESYSWQIPYFDPRAEIPLAVLAKTPPQVRILPSKYDHFIGGITRGSSSKLIGGEWVSQTNPPQSLGVGMTADDIVETAYQSDSLRTAFLADIPKGRYDYIANQPHDALNNLQEEIKKRFGLVGRWENRAANVLVLKSAEKRPAGLGLGAYRSAPNEEMPVKILKNELESWFQLPVVNETGLTNLSFGEPVFGRNDDETHKQMLIKRSLYDQLSLELVPTNMPIEMLVVQKAK